MSAKKIQLVLSSGGARGMAHIGAIEELSKAGYEITEIVGCSMGAVVGGLYGSGHLQEYKEWLIQLDRSSVFELTDFTLTRQGFVKGEKVFGEILDMTGKQFIEDFPIRFTAVATDLMTMEEVLYSEGDLFEALRASISIPGIFLPVYDHDRILVDGGVLNPLPLDKIQRKEDHLVVAVNVSGPSSVADFIRKEQAQKKKNGERNKNWFERTFDLIDRDDSKKKYKLSLFDLMDTTFSFTQDRLTQMILRVFPPDILIEIPRTTADTFDFHKADTIIKKGAKAAKKALAAHSKSEAE